MSKKWFSVIAVFMLVAMLLGACGPAAAPSGATQRDYEKVDPKGQTVVWWHNHTKPRDEFLNKIIDDFNKTNQYGVTVKAEYQGSYTDISKKMLPILNTPDVPALIVGYQNDFATYQLDGGLIDMNPLVNSKKYGISAEDQKDFFPGFWAQDVNPSFGNARLGFPPNRSMEVLFYNMDWLKQMGYNEPPKTPEQFKEMACKAVKNPYAKATAKDPMGYELSIDASRFASWTFAFGGDVFDAKNNKYTYNSEAAVKAWTFIQDLFKSGCATVVSKAYQDQTDFGAGKLLFAVGSSSGLPFYATAVKDGAKHAWSVGALPYTGKEPAMNVYGGSVAIPKSTPEKELAAWLFVKYYTSKDIQAGWAKVSQYFPVRASVADGLKDVFAADPAYKASWDMLKYSKFEPSAPGYGFVRDEVGKVMAKLVAEPYPDVKTTLDALDKAANANLAEQMAKIKK
ncbi:MAG TPA: extracellular solute-binding protein [Anaerolineaceae bacterium]